VFIYLLAERNTPEDIRIYADYVDPIFDEMDKRGYAFTPLSRAYHTTTMGYYYQMTDRWEESIAYELKAADYMKDYKDVQGKWDYADRLSSVGKSYAHSGKYEEALDYLARSQKLFEECKSEGFVRYIKSIWYCYRRLFDCHRRMGNYEKATYYGKTAIDYLTEYERRNLLSNRIFIVQAYYDLAEIYFYANDKKNCKTYLKQGLEHYNQLDKFQQNKAGGVNVRKRIDQMYESLKPEA
jgi:tetratricopeptide (TPR) repeat protein